VSDTPRTDDFYKDRFKAPDAIDFARQLERELAEAEDIGNGLARELADARQIARDAYAHNDSLKDAIDSYRRLLNHAAGG
jgi:hypothetical protein